MFRLGVRVLARVAKPTETSHCDKVDSKGPCCEGKPDHPDRAGDPDQRVCGTGVSSGDRGRSSYPSSTHNHSRDSQVTYNMHSDPFAKNEGNRPVECQSTNYRGVSNR